MNSIIGREREINSLQWCLEKGESQFVVVYGRRRVGKTFLIKEFFKNEFTFSMTGIYGATKEIQLANFTIALRQYWNRNFKIPKDWTEAFYLLRDYLQEKKKKGKHRVVFFDEIPWLDTQKSDLLRAIEVFWNPWAAWEEDIVFIMTASSVPWIKEKILHNIGGLYNRCTLQIYLPPFNLRKTELFLQYKGINWSRYDVASCHLIMGGIPYYLNLLNPELPLDKNIDEIFFGKNVKLQHEYEQICETSFKNTKEHTAVIEALVSKKEGLTRNEILEKTGLPNNGLISKILENLIYCDFVQEYNYFGNKKRESVYQLCDFFTIFYYNFLKGNTSRDKHFWSNLKNNEQKELWADNAFEQLCKDHLQQIKKAIGIGSVISEFSLWFNKPDEYTRENIHIGLLIDRNDNVIDICEMKFCNEEYEIDKDCDMSIRNKIGTFQFQTNTRKAVCCIMITPFGVKRGMYSDIVRSQVCLDDLFSIVDRY